MEASKIAVHSDFRYLNSSCIIIASMPVLGEYNRGYSQRYGSERELNE